MKTYIENPKRWESFIMTKENLLNGNATHSAKAFQDLMERFNAWAQNNGYGIIYNEQIGYHAVKKANYTDGAVVADLPVPGFKLAKPADKLRIANEDIKRQRSALMIEEADPLKYDYEEALAKGNKNAEALKKLWLAKKDEIRKKLPYLTEDE